MENKIEKSEIIEGLDSNVTDHEYDGIIELDNALPPWWLYMFYGTIIFAIIYVILFFGMGKFKQQDELKAEYAVAAEKIEAYQKEHGAAVDENTVVLVTDADKLADGKAIYEKNCVACHAVNGGGGVGPNFTDDYWIHGNSINEVFKVVKYGVPEKGMIPWEAQLNPEQMQNVASYILNEFTGKNVEGGKEPQGEKVN
ncbi:MAG: c-type cytochrome [Flavobacteriales bacterium]|nr:c-type cytochrome [Flavobacteriales bacterium]MCW8912674.1 c-type cytochrome [Flavobacteriales bacterium]MCW8938279.1 c-type cytochrome [Flavobacteriales bacterium]MCW8939718.1 c-type cytochrome [Flavobacteriales bacterium]MCW8967374.1 c-type cytochrome [Flavobacteriales bacterium]